MRILCCVAIIFALLFSTGCLQPTGCLPVVIQDKHVTSTPNVMSLLVRINNVDYEYSNPKLDTFSQIDINKTYMVQFDPMNIGKPEVELCGETK